MLKININGITRPMTLTEQAEYERLAAELAQMQPEPSPEEKRMDEIEAALIELAAMLAGGEV